MKKLHIEDYQNLSHGDLIQTVCTAPGESNETIEYFRIVKCMYELDFFLALIPTDEKGNVPDEAPLEVFNKREFYTMINDTEEWNGGVYLCNNAESDLEVFQTDSKELFEEMKASFVEFTSSTEEQ